MDDRYKAEMTDHGPAPYAANMGRMADRNKNFRTAVWTGDHLQMTLMSIPQGGEIGLENHPDTDQMVRVEQGNAVVKMGQNKNQMDFQKLLDMGEVVFIPAGTWHNIINTGRNPLKVSSVYGPPNHPRGTLQRTKAEAEREEG